MSLYLTNFQASRSIFDQYSTKLVNIWPFSIGHILTIFSRDENVISEIVLDHSPFAVLIFTRMPCANNKDTLSSLLAAGNQMLNLDDTSIFEIVDVLFDLVFMEHTVLG